MKAGGLFPSALTDYPLLWGPLSLMSLVQTARVFWLKILAWNIKTYYGVRGTFCVLPLLSSFEKGQ